MWYAIFSDDVRDVGMARQNERSANNALSDLLRGMMHGCEVRSESTRTISEQSGSQPDILITAADRAPVVIEAEYMPAAEVEEDAAKRLGLEAANTGRKIEAVIALRYPHGLEFAYSLADAVAGARLSYSVLTAPGQDGEEYDRFPESGWLEGSVADVADLARLVSVPQSAVNAAASALETGIDSAVGVLNSLERLSPVAAREVADLLGMSDVPQTRRMACAIVANAMVFHDRIAAMHPEILPLNRLWGTGADNPQGKVSEAWDAILDINYWPIFAVARDIVNLLPSHAAARILEHLRTTAHRINATGANVAHDLTGRVFQRLIVDRKYLATFYTLPASAALLARLAVDKLEGIDWSDAEAIGKLKVGDFACGTGALLAAVYEQFATRHEHAGGDAAELHQAMMEDVLYGCDVMPSAIHITGSTLSGIQPNVGYDNSRLYNMPYGRQADGTVAIGSLELLQSSAVMTLFNTNDPAMRTGSTGEETAARVLVDVQDEAFDIVIMNPPFTRNTNKEGAYANTFAGAFAAFDATVEDQRAMAKRMSILKRDTCYHGHAGMASAFAGLADKKLKPGGVLALVLPLSAASGFAWQFFRQMMGSRYTDISVLSIAANGKDMSFSSDTGMAECLVIARKVEDAEQPRRTQFTSLHQRPKGLVEASAVARSITVHGDVRRIEDGPYGGTLLQAGDETVGEMLSAPQMDAGQNWGAVRLRDYSLVQTNYALSQGNLLLPANPVPLKLSVKSLGDFAEFGFHHLDITGLPSKGPPQGPFDKVSPSPTATYPCLWNHNAKNETRMICQPDSQLSVRQGMEAKAASVWATASRGHLNLDFRLNSQPLAAAFTERASIGGRAWPNVIFEDNRFDTTFVVWSNTTLGLISFWWNSNRQQDGRSIITIRSAKTLPVLDFRTLSDDQLATAKAIFDEFRDLELKPAYLADADENRALLDRRVVCDLLGFSEDTYQAVRLLAAKWCAEPSVHGGKSRG